MTLIVEDGTQVANANSYIDDSYIESFLSVRGLLSTTLDTDEKRKSMALRAMDFLNTQDYCGNRVSDNQSLPFPRENINLSDNRKLEPNVIPSELKQAQAWLIYYIDSGTDPASVPEQNLKRKKIDTLDKEYQDGSDFRQVSIDTMPNVVNLLKHLVCQSDYLGRA